MKRGRKITAFFGAAAVLAGAWLLAAYMARDPAVEAARLSEELESVRLPTGSGRELTALSWSWEGETVNLYRDAASGRWMNGDDKTCPVDDVRAEALARAAVSVTASSVLPETGEGEEYGLEPPALTVVAATETDIMGYDVGSRSAEGEYYLRLHGSDRVYLAGGELPAAFRVGIMDLLALETVPEDIGEVTELAVTSAAESYRIACDEGEETWYRTDGEEPAALDEEGARALCEAVTSLALTDCVTWNGAPEDYGLKEPQLTAAVTYRDRRGEKQRFTLEFGDYTEGKVYVRFAGSAMVYRVDGGAADELMYPRWERMAPAPVVTLDPSAIAEIAVTMDGETVEIARLEEEVERAMAQGDGSVTVTDVIYSRNGWVLDTPQMDAWLRSFSDLVTEGDTPAGEGRETLLSVTFTWKDAESSPFTLEIRNYDSARYLCLAGGERLLVRREAADRLMDRARSILTDN